MITFDEENIHGRIFTDVRPAVTYRITGGKPLYYRGNNRIYEEVEILQDCISLSDDSCISSKLLYRNRCEIGYELPEDIDIKDKELEKYR